MLKSRGTCSISCLRLRTTVETNGIYNSLVCSSLIHPSSTCGVVDARREILLSPSAEVIVCSHDSWMSVGQLLELCRKSTCSFPDFSRNCSVAVLELWVESLLVATFSLLHHLFVSFLSSGVVRLVLLAELLCLLSSLCWLKGVFGSWCQTTSGIGDTPVVLAVSGLSHAVPEWRRDVLSLKREPQPWHFRLYWSVCLVVDLILFHCFFLMRRSVCCIGSKITFPCGIVRFATRLTAWVDSSWFSVKIRLLALLALPLLTVLLLWVLEIVWLLLLLLLLLLLALVLLVSFW